MAEPIRIISSMATRQLLTELLAAFGRESPQPVQLESVGGVDAAKRVQAGEAFDIVALASDAIDKLIEAGRLAPHSRVDLVRSGVAVAVRSGATRPDIGSGEAVRQGLRTAAFAEAVLVDASQVVPIPRAVPLASAALLACGVVTGLGAVLNTAAVRPGSHVVTIGTGGVGLNCVQGAALSQARTNIAIDLSDQKLAAARRFGADQTINPAKDEPREAVLALTGGRGADYVLVAAGSAAAIELGATLVRRGGTLVIVGMTADGVKVRLEAVDLADRALRILGSKMGAVRPRLDLPLYAEWYLAGRLKLDELISGRFPLEAINEAVGGTRDGSALRNVVLLGAEAA